MKLIHPDVHFTFPFAGSAKDTGCNDLLPQWRAAVAHDPYFGLEEWNRRLHVENKQLNITIKECHEMHRKLSMRPFEASNQVLIVWHPEFLGREGNSLLKLIEEPSSSSQIIFIAESREQLLSTLLSRMQVVRVPGYTDNEITGFLTDRGQSLETALGVAKFVGGDWSSAQALMRGELTDQRIDVERWLALCRAGSVSQLAKWTDQVIRSGDQGREQRKQFLKLAMEQLKNETALNKGLTFERIQKGVDLLDKSIYYTERHANLKILFLDVSLQLSRLFSLPSQI